MSKKSEPKTDEEIGAAKFESGFAELDKLAKGKTSKKRHTGRPRT